MVALFQYWWMCQKTLFRLYCKQLVFSFYHVCVPWFFYTRKYHSSISQARDRVYIIYRIKLKNDSNIHLIIINNVGELELRLRDARMNLFKKMYFMRKRESERTVPFSSEYTESPVCKRWRYKNAHRMKEAKHIHVYGNSFSRLSLNVSTVARNKVYGTTCSLWHYILWRESSAQDFFRITSNNVNEKEISCIFNMKDSYESI